VDYYETIVSKWPNNQKFKNLFFALFRRINSTNGNESFLAFFGYSFHTMRLIHSFFYHWFLKEFSRSSLKSYYSLLSSGMIPLTALTETTIQIALSCVP